MAYKGVLEDVNKCIKLGVPDRIPVFALTEEFDSEQAGMTYEEYGSNPDNIARVHINAVKNFDYDWICVYIDDCLEFEPLGVKTVGEGNIPKSVFEQIKASYDNLNNLQMPDPGKDGRMPVLPAAIKKIKEQLGDSVLICGRAPAPFSAATLLYGVEQTMLLMYDEPELLADTMKFLMNVELRYARAQIEAGAHALWIGDCCASSRFLSVEHFKSFVLDITSDYIAELKKMGVITIYFGAEKSILHLQATTEIKPDIIALSEDANLIECKSAVGDKVCLMGNLDPIDVLQDGTPETIKSEIEKMMSLVGKQGGYLFNTGEGVTRNTPAVNVQAIVKSLRSGWHNTRKK